MLTTSHSPLKKTVREKLAPFISLFVFSIALSSCSVFEPPKSPIRIGINAWPGYEFLYLAKVKGFYEREGVDVQIVEFDSLSDGRRAYERGNLDALACTLIEHLLILDSSNRNPIIAAVADYSDGADVAVMKTGSQSASLEGARIGLENQSLGIYMLYRLLEREGLSLKDVKIKPLNQSIIESQFCDDEIDVAISYPPTSIKLIQDFDASSVFSSSEIPGEVVDIIVFEKSLLEDRAKEADSILKAFFDAQEWALQNKEEAFAIMGDREGLSAEEFGIALTDGLAVVKRGEQDAFFAEGSSLVKALEKCDLVLRETGQLKNPARFQSSILR